MGVPVPTILRKRQQPWSHGDLLELPRVE
jgi:hypothetical protein